MRRLVMIAACTLCFFLGRLLPLTRTHAQNTTASRTYYVIDYMKSKSGQDPYRMEHDLWKPVQQERLRNGDITSWAVMTPVLAGPHNYDYITVTGYRSADAYTKLMTSGFGSVFEKIWGKDKVQSSLTQTEQARDMLGSEMYVVADSVTGPNK